eukprot:52929_1
MEDEKQKYDEDVVNELVKMGIATRNEIIIASTNTINYKNINDVLDTINEMNNYNNTIINDNKIDFELNWNHIISAIKQELNNNTALRIKDIIYNEKYKEISINDSPYNSSDKLLKIISEKKKFLSKISKKEMIYIKELIQRATQFNPSSANKTIHNHSFTQNCKYSYDFNENGLLHFLHHQYGLDNQFTITCSELSQESAGLEYLIDPPIKWMIKTKPSANKSFIAIHFNEIKLKLKKK